MHWSHVSDRAFRVLVKMALTAKDKPTAEVPAGLYFGGHDGLVDVLAAKEGTSHQSMLRTVRRATDELEEVGAIRVTHAAISGGNAVYELTLNAIALPRRRSNAEAKHFTIRDDSTSPIVDEQADTTCPTEADTECPTGPDNPCPIQADTTCPTYKEPLEEPLEELKEEEGVALTTDLTVTRANSAERENPQSNSPSCRDPTCQLGYLYDRTKPKGQRNIPCPTCRPAAKVIPFQRKVAT